jgi:DNA-3-methyladenine glycosylase II
MLHSFFEFVLPLPDDYSPADALHFHGRDAECVAEEVSASGIRKGVLLNGMPAVLDIRFGDGMREAACSVDVDGPLAPDMPQHAQDILRNMLGLRIDPEEFAAFAHDDPLFGPLIARHRGLRVVQSSSVFEALTWAIMGQQINVAFATSLRRSFIRLAGRRHRSGLWCYPAPADAGNVPLEAFTARQFSRTKAETLLRLSGMLATGALDLDVSPANPIERICEKLLAVKGVGPWTVNYVLLRGYAYPDCSLHGDVAVRTALHALHGGDARPGIAQAEEWLRPYGPHRTMAAAHLWASLHTRVAY